MLFMYLNNLKEVALVVVEVSEISTGQPHKFFFQFAMSLFKLSFSYNPNCILSKSLKNKVASRLFLEIIEIRNYILVLSYSML